MSGAQLSPVLLVGAGTGEATCGILYIASYLRRNDIEAYVRLTDADETEEEIEQSLAGLVAHVRPKLVGISLKWFHHVSRAKVIAQTLKKIDPSIQIALGGNSATYWAEELLAWDCIDHVLLGDGELPMLALCRGDEAPPNVVNRSTPKSALKYIDGTAKSDVYYSHFDQLFLSQLDLHSYSGWVAPGKGCGENCLYCGGTRGMQKATFGRAKPFLRAEEIVRKDHQEIVPRTWQLRYDFAGSTAKFLESTWQGVDLSRHSCTYFLWGVPPPELAQTLSKNFHRAYMVLDIGCFSESQRLETMKRGLLKPCPTNEELFKVIDRCKAFPNLQLEISGIAGLPYATQATLLEERKLVEQVLGLGCSIGYQRLESQPGALVTEHPDRFGMTSEASDFGEFLEYFEQRPEGQNTVPMVRFADKKFEQAVQRTSDEVDAMIWDAVAQKNDLAIDGKTRLINRAAFTQQFDLGAWLGSYRVPAKFAREKVTVVRSIDGAGLSCTPTVSRKKFSDPLLQQGEEGSALLDVLAAFDKPTTVNAALQKLKTRSAQDVIEHLAAGKFLQRA